jgi:hypothetical protein
LPSTKSPLSPLPAVCGFRNPEREPSPPREQDCTCGPRSFVDVLDCLM